jgi:RNA polymerase sigma-70 factor (ECF subfamily)
LNVSQIEEAFEQTRRASRSGFALWVRLCEIPLRKSLRRFARAVDVEAVMQEGLLRMWRLAPTLQLEGENASLRYATTLMRNLALSEARRLKKLTTAELAELEQIPEGRVDPDPPSDTALRQAIMKCLAKLPDKPREALLARLRGGNDRDTAAGLNMRLNTFLQNIVRARRFLAECLESAGIRVAEFL